MNLTEHFEKNIDILADVAERYTTKSGRVSWTLAAKREPNLVEILYPNGITASAKNALKRAWAGVNGKTWGGQSPRPAMRKLSAGALAVAAPAPQEIEARPARLERRELLARLTKDEIVDIVTRLEVLHCPKCGKPLLAHFLAEKLNLTR